jgi:hypothetical protein
MAPLKLSDDQLGAVMHAARPLQPADRDGFLQAVATALAAIPEDQRGDGVVYQICREAQRRHFIPPVGIDGPPPRKFGTPKVA